MTGVSRFVAVVAGHPQNPVLYVVQSVCCHFGAAALHEDSAAPTAGRRRFAGQVCVLEGLQPDASLVPTLQNTLGAYHCRSERTEMRRDRGWALITMRQQEEDIQIHIHIPSVMLPDAEQGYQAPAAWRTWNTRGRVTTVACFVSVTLQIENREKLGCIPRREEEPVTT